MIALLLLLAAVALLILAAFPRLLASRKFNPAWLAAALIVIAVLVMPRWDTLT